MISDLTWLALCQAPLRTLGHGVHINTEQRLGLLEFQLGWRNLGEQVAHAAKYFSRRSAGPLWNEAVYCYRSRPSFIRPQWYKASMQPEWTWRIRLWQGSEVFCFCIPSCHASPSLLPMSLLGFEITYTSVSRLASSIKMVQSLHTRIPRLR